MIRKSDLNDWVLALTVVLITSIVACTQMGVEPLSRAPQNVKESLYIAQESGKGMTQTFMDLRTQQLISQEQFQAAIGYLQKAHDGAQQGLNLYAMGNYGEATTTLDRVEQTLHLVAAILAQINEAKP